MVRRLMSREYSPVHAASDYAEAGFALSDERIQKKKDALVDMMALLYAWMRARGPL